MDNAAVGNILALIREDTTKGILLFFVFFEMRKEETRSTYVADWGERPESCISAMGSRVPA